MESAEDLWGPKTQSEPKTGPGCDICAPQGKAATGSYDEVEGPGVFCWVPS